MTRAPGITEWWQVVAAGVEHGVTLRDRTPGIGSLDIEVGFDGAHARPIDHDGVLLVDENERTVGSYTHLVVVDADGARLPARMEPSARGVLLHVDDDGARYPVVVDPLVFVLETTLTAPPSDSQFGRRVAVSADGSRAVALGILSTGNALVYARTGSTWSLESRLVRDSRCDLQSANRVVMAADGSRLALTGIIGSSDQGTCVFSRSGSVWSLEARIDTVGPLRNYDQDASLASSSDMTRVLVGNRSGDTPTPGRHGTIDVYLRVGTAWTLEATILNADTFTFRYATLVVTDGDASHLIVGSATQSGGPSTLLTYSRSGATWSLDGPLAIPGPTYPAAGGMSADGSRALIGFAPRFDFSGQPASVVVLTRSGTTWSTEATLSTAGTTREWGSALALDSTGTRALVSDAAVATGGIARIFERTGATWSQAASLMPTTSAAGDRFGNAVAFSDVPGARAFVASTPGAGRVWIFEEKLPVATACTTDDQCGSGFCTDGLCCATACAGGSADCQACSVAAHGSSEGTCTFFGSGTECRASAGACDLREVCSGSSSPCPPDLRAAPGTMCRGVLTTCDAADFCDGASVLCRDDVAAAGTICNPSSGVVCDLPDLCDGTTSLCAPRYADGTTVCRPSMGECDIAETCSGTSMGCPSDAFAAATTVCGSAPAGVCDAPDRCTGTSADCMPTFVAGAVCRPSMGGCDLAESCTGADAECPPDVVLAAAAPCRISTAACDPAELCDGVATTCPADIACAGADAGTRDAGRVPSDGAVGADAASAPVAASGCGCRAGRSLRASPGGALLAVLVLLARRRRGRSESEPKASGPT